jgi:hypothetical protein
MIEFLDKNKEWVFSGAGITVLTLLVVFGRRAFGSFTRKGPTVRVSAAMAGNGFTRPMDLVAITVQNRADHVLYLGNIFLELNTRNQFMPTLDPLTGSGQENRQLQPGNSFSFHIPVTHIIESGLPLEAFRCAVVRDGVDRLYRSSRRELRKVLQVASRRHRRVSMPL